MLSTHFISAGADANKLVRAPALSSIKFKPSSSWITVFSEPAQVELVINITSDKHQTWKIYRLKNKGADVPADFPWADSCCSAKDVDRETWRLERDSSSLTRRRCDLIDLSSYIPERRSNSAPWNQHWWKNREETETCYKPATISNEQPPEVISAISDISL